VAYKAEIAVDVKGLKAVRTLESSLNKISGKISAINKISIGNSKAAKIEEKVAKSKEAQRVSMIQTRRVGDAVQRGADKGLQTEKALAAVKRAAKADAQGQLKVSEAQRKIALEELKVNQGLTQEKVKQVNLQRQMASPIGGIKTMMGSPAQQAFSGGPSSSILGSKTTFGSPKFFDSSAKIGGPSIPVKGAKDIYGSPAYYAATNKEAKRVARANAVPIKGFKDLPGSPAYFEEQAKNARSSALNFDKRTGKLLRGPAGSGGGGFRNLARRFDTGSALISGGFPLLFGQGPAVAAAGALGGGIGGMFGQMGGFAGGIATTAAVQSIQNAVTAVSQLGQALSPITPNIQALSQSLGLVGTQEQKRLELIEEVRGKQAAFNAAVDEMRRVIGDEATEKLREFGESTRLIGSEFSIAMTKMQSALAGLFGAVDRFLGLTRGAERSQRNRAIAGSDDPEIVRRREEIERLQNTTGGGRSGAKNRQDRIKTLKAELDELGKQEVVVNNIATRRQNLNLIESSAGKKLRQENELLQAKLDGNFEEVQLAQQLDAEIQKRLDKGMGIMEIDIDSISNAIKLNNKLEKQVELSEKIGSNFEQIGESIASGVSDNLTAAIQGTKTLGDAAKSILNDLSSTLIKLGVNTILKGISPGFFGSLTGLGFARGGRPPVGKASVVGERGPELFVPRRSGTVVPNDKLGGGSTNISVNVDASGSSVQGDEQQSKELGKAISAAIQSELLKQRRPGGLLR